MLAIVFCFVFLRGELKLVVFMRLDVAPGEMQIFSRHPPRMQIFSRHPPRVLHRNAELQQAEQESSDGEPRASAAARPDAEHGAPPPPPAPLHPGSPARAGDCLVRGG